MALRVEQRENIISMLERGCGLREIYRSLHVSLSNVYNIKHAHVPNGELGIEVDHR